MKNGLKHLFHFVLVLGVLQTPMTMLTSNPIPKIICPCGTMQASDCCEPKSAKPDCPSIQQSKADYQALVPFRVELPSIVMMPSLQQISQNASIIRRYAAVFEAPQPSPPLRSVAHPRAPPASSVAA